eukprot:CAMPEP_0118638628 /NCGR_PEP_ID=MMETSP0785-20121206/3792_1 /TAXON_ID=91992 /ORGANISM="Bolidomonas pacifica, Strain CCMP 1866" /LENGTH=69 /DNA_ID=CAMNT_0006529903 /DNA_START=616 /DNA_END=825 /DNA_ORIENTATION=-
MKGAITSTRLSPGVRAPRGPDDEADDATSWTTGTRDVGGQPRRVEAETREPAEEPRNVVEGDRRDFDSK